jgi:hypothetical protein
VISRAILRVVCQKILTIALEINLLSKLQRPYHAFYHDIVGLFRTSSLLLYDLVTKASDILRVLLSVFRF